MDATTIIQDVETYAKEKFQQAGTLADQLLDNVGKDAPTELQHIEDDTLNVFLDFVPSAYRSAVSGFVTPLVQGAETKINATIDASIASGIAIAKARINAITGATG